MPLVNINWQITKPTIRERTKFMLNNDRFSDVKFVVRNGDGESESTEVISAHKFVLSIGSPVFENMFYSELAETRDCIQLPDCEYDDLLEFFRYMYSDEVYLNGSNVLGVLCLAKKYVVPSLAEKCMEYLQNDLDPSSVFSVLPFAQKYEETDLVDRCWAMIDEETEAAVKSDGFASIERSLLEAVVERESLHIAEVELFKGVVRWATKQSEKLGIVADGKEKRRIIGEQIVKALRFPVMKQEEFASVVVDSGILMQSETADLIKYFSSTGNTCVGFSVNKRSKPSCELMRCRRFRSVEFGLKNSYSTSRLGVSVDSDSVLLHGVNMFGSKDSNYSVIMVVFTGLFKFLNSDIVACTRGEFPSVVDNSGKYYCFDVLFDKPIPLKKGVIYCLDVTSFNGPDSWYGIKGDYIHRCSGITFTLRNYYYPFGNNTGTRYGQFNEFIFSLC